MYYLKKILNLFWRVIKESSTEETLYAKRQGETLRRLYWLASFVVIGVACIGVIAMAVIG
ncbi:MAG: hypothetical protein OXB96_02425 [Candidatus Kaiserbacteria bacterium]|nr:hypothetical protein [Candidatus Kaiserbacteria bacterium]